MVSPQTAQSSQSFVRALKAPTDPPKPDGPHKVEIAREAWDDTSFYVPSKGEVIVDWLLTTLLKDKAKELSNPILDLRYWTLLADIISFTDLQVQNAKSHPQKTWLKALLNRIPIVPIVLAFISLIRTLSSSDCLSLTPVVRQCLAIVWPLGIQKATSDILLECFGGVLNVSKDDDGMGGNDSLANIGEMVTASFRIAFENASNKKKIHQTFIQSHLHNWLECTWRLSAASSTQQSHLLNIYTTGTNILFAVDMLRPLQTQSASALIFVLPTNLKSLLSGHSPQVLSALPRLFASFVQSVRKHRGTLFSQSPASTLSGASAEAEVRKTAMAFFVSCMVLVDESGDSDRTTVWKTRVHLLGIVDKETLFHGAGAHMDMGNEAEAVLRNSADVATKAIASASQDDDTGLTRLAITVLSILARIDYDLIAPSVPKILSALLFVSEETEALAFLNLLLDYHTKTRTMHTYISAVLSAVISPSYSSHARKAYTAAFSSPLLHLMHLDRLSKCTNNFLTPGQTQDTMIGVLNTLKHTWDMFWEAQQSVTANSGEGPRKKRKLALDDLLSAKAGDPDVSVVAFALTARISSMALSSLPLQSLPDSMRLDVRQTLVDAQSNFIQSALQMMFKMIRRNLLDPNGDAWACQVGTASTLRLEYTLVSARYLGIRAKIDENVFSTMLDVVEDGGTLPELSGEIFRSLLNSLAHSTQSHKVLESLLRYLERSPVAPNWSGSSCKLSFGKSGQEQTALALIRLLIDRWLPVVDLLASQQHLERLARLMINMKSDFPAKTREGCRPSTIFNQALRSAHFWELINTRDALFSLINEETSCLAIIDPSETQTVLLSEKLLIPLISQNRLQQAISAYELLLYVPIEYVPKASRLDLIRRALAADLVLCQTACDDTHSQKNFVRSVTILRVFLTRWFSYQSFMDHATIRLYAQHLITSSQKFTEITSELLSATLDLFDLHISVLLRSSDPGILEIMSAAATFESSAAETWGTHIVPLGITRFLRLVTADFSTSDFSDTILSCMKSLYGRLFRTIDPRMCIIVSDDIPLDHMLGQSDILQVWCHVLSFGRWLHTEDSPAPFGKRLVAKIASANHSLFASSADHLQLGKLCFGTLAILLEEMYHYSESSRLSHLDVIIATYVCLGRISDLNDWHKFDLLLSKTCKDLPIVDFSHMLDLCWESLSGDGLSPKDMTCLVHLSNLLLHHAPQGTLKIIQGFTTHTINMFVSCPIFYSGPLSLRLGVLDFVAQHCCDRPAALRSLDHSSIWSLLSKSLCGSKQHDPTTSTAIFHHIVSIISSTVRLRRDLVVCTLPHLGMILRQLIMVMRRLRPQLGAKQCKMVTDTFPVWINGGHPLAAEEGRALARLLTTLTSKTIVRTHQSSSTDSQKAESLAKPFSKHAIYILKSYVDAMNDPLCVMPLDVRKELQPGLFSLCDMISEHSRDAMMVSALDAGGKATMKALWKEHEKQRYVGKG